MGQPEHDRRDDERAEQPISAEKTQTCESAARLRNRRGPRTRMHKKQDEQARDEKRRRVDDENRGRTENADQDSGEDRPEDRRSLRDELEERVGPTDARFVFARELGHEDVHRRAVGSPERADSEREHDE